MRKAIPCNIINNFSTHARHMLLRVCERRTVSSHRYSIYYVSCKRLLIANTSRTMSTNSTQNVSNGTGKPRYIDVSRPFLLPKLQLLTKSFLTVDWYQPHRPCLPWPLPWHPTTSRRPPRRPLTRTRSRLSKADCHGLRPDRVREGR